MNDINDYIENIRNLPLQLVHGKLFPHSGIQQSQKYYDKCKESGVSARFDIMEGDTQWDFRDEYRISFDYFKDKKLIRNPDTFTFSTSQLKYASAYWIEIRRLSECNRKGIVNAR